jgi:hypothetical protein
VSRRAPARFVALGSADSPGSQSQGGWTLSPAPRVRRMRAAVDPGFGLTRAYTPSPLRGFISHQRPQPDLSPASC